MLMPRTTFSVLASDPARGEQKPALWRKRSKDVFRKVTLALVAVASPGVMALAPTAASAKPPMIWNPNPHFDQNHWNPAFGLGVVAAGLSGCYQNRLVLTPFGYRVRTVDVWVS